MIFHVVTNNFLKANQTAVRAFLADYVRGLQWFYDPANRKRAVEITAEFTKTPGAVLDQYFMTPRDYYRDRNGCVSAGAIQVPVDACQGRPDRQAGEDRRLSGSLPAAGPVQGVTTSGSSD